MKVAASFRLRKEWNGTDSKLLIHEYLQKHISSYISILKKIILKVKNYFTYGISLLVVTLIDFFLFKRIKELGVCYQCEAEFRNHSMITNLPAFDLELHDYYRNLKKDVR